MINLAFQIAIIVALALLNGLLAMSETALVSSRKARLGQRAEAGDRGARTAMELADEPTRFLSTVQIGISLIGVLAGAFGGATLAEPLSGVLGGVPGLAPYSWAVAFVVVVAAITCLSLIIGELVPNRLALNDPEAVSSHVARPMRFLTILASPGVPGVWLLSASTEVVLRLLGARRSEDPPVTEQEFEALLARLAFSTPRRCPGSQRRMRLAGKGSVALLATVSATRARHRSRSAERFDLTLHG